jgi:hypothetical protein
MMTYFTARITITTTISKMKTTATGVMIAMSKVSSSSSLALKEKNDK